MGYIYPQAAFRIDGLYPPEVGQEFGRYGFGIALDARFAKQCLDAPRPKMERITRMADECIARVFSPAARLGSHPLNWYGDTCLLHGLSVPGNACDLTADYNDISRIAKDGVTDPTHDVWGWALEYQPHNVDGIRQVYAMLSIWMTWYNCVTATLLVKP